MGGCFSALARGAPSFGQGSSPHVHCESGKDTQQRRCLQKTEKKTQPFPIPSSLGVVSVLPSYLPTFLPSISALALGPRHPGALDTNFGPRLLPGAAAPHPAPPAPPKPPKLQRAERRSPKLQLNIQTGVKQVKQVLVPVFEQPSGNTQARRMAKCQSTPCVKRSCSNDFLSCCCIL